MPLVRALPITGDDLPDADGPPEPTSNNDYEQVASLAAFLPVQQ